MKMIRYRWFWAWNAEKEEKWLNEMARQGWNLSGIGFCRYTFEEGEAGVYQYRLELLEHYPYHPESQRYIRFLEDTGVEEIGSVQRWAYFRKRTSGEPFHLFSDIDSKIKHLRRINVLLTPLCCMDFYMGLHNLNLGLEQNRAEQIGVAIPLLLLGILVGIGVFKICRQIRRLKKERNLHE